MRISRVVSCPSNPCLPVWQKTQFILQPIWHETHSVALSASGMKTVSMVLPLSVGKRYFTVPSFDLWLTSGLSAPTQYSAPRSSLLRFEIFVISSIDRACCTYSHRAICPPVKAGMPSERAISFSSASVCPRRGFFSIVFSVSIAYGWRCCAVVSCGIMPCGAALRVMAYSAHAPQPWP